MNSKGYTLSYLERKKEQNEQINNNISQSLQYIPQQQIIANIDYQQILNIAKYKIPYIQSEKPTHTISIDKIKVSDLKNLKLMIAKENTNANFKCRYEENGVSAVCVLLKFKDLEEAQKCYDNFRNSNIQQLRWCFEIKYDQEITYVCYPENTALKKIIDKLAKLLISEGYSIEKHLKDRDDSIFNFIRYNNCLQNQYYRWRVYSYLMGDGQKFFREQAYKMHECGSWWKPPKQRMAIKLLTSEQRRYFANIIYNLSTKRYRIQQGMVFCIKNHEKSIQIITILYHYLLIEQQNKKIAIFYLLSDIIHNSLLLSYPNLLKASLPNIFQKLNGLLSNQIKNKFNSILQIWRNKVLFDDDFLDGLQFLLMKDTRQYIQIQNELMNKNHEQIFNQCRRYGLPRNKQSLLTLSRFLNLKFEVSNSKVGKAKEGLYDGVALNEQQIYKIRHNSVKVISFHNINYLEKFNSICKSYDEQG